MILALCQELFLRKSEIDLEIIETIYFGGGTPSRLSVDEINFILKTVFSNYQVATNPEITLEANPDDLTNDYIIALSQSKINRLSIGVQSFFEEDLVLMNRAHNVTEAKKSIELATQYFDNISIDLIYGIPGLTNKMWQENIQTAIDFGINHISSYALTVEPKTALEKLIRVGKIATTNDNVSQQHFEILVKTLTDNNFIHYELSNFGKPDYFSKNNSNYWLGQKYLGIGPSAHSYDGKSRSWNVANNAIYLKKINQNILPCESEILTRIDIYNEYVMTGLRTIWGINLDKIAREFGTNFLDYLLHNAQKFINQDLLYIENNTLKITNKGKFLSDGIASDLFFVVSN